MKQIANGFYITELSLLRTAFFGSNEVHIDNQVSPDEQQSIISTTVQELFHKNSMRLQQVLAGLPQKSAISLGLGVPEHFDVLSWEHIVFTSLKAAGLSINVHPYVYRYVVNQRSWKQRGPVQSPPLRILLVLDRPDREFALKFQKQVLSSEGYQRLLRWAQLIQYILPTAVQFTVLDQSVDHPVTPDVLANTLQQGFDVVYWPITVRQARDMSSFIVFMQAEYYHSQEYTRTLRSLINPPRLWLLAGEETELLAQELIKDGLAGAVVGVRGYADPDQLQPLFRRLTAEVLRNGRVDIARTRMYHAFPEQEAADQVVVWSTEDGLNVIDLDTVAQYRSLLEVIAQGENNTEEAAL